MKPVIERTSDGGWVFWCPGCAEPHVFDKRWTFDGNMEKPTFTPSLLVHHVPGAQPLCHSFVTGGVIQYLGDCEHALAGKTVPMEPLDWDVYEAKP